MFTSMSVYTGGGSKKKGGREKREWEIKGKIIGRNPPNYYSNCFSCKIVFVFFSGVVFLYFSNFLYNQKFGRIS